MSESPTTDQPEPIGEASNKLVGGLTATAMAAEGAVSALRNRGNSREAGHEQVQRQAIDREAEAQIAADKATYSVMLDPKTATKAGPVATMDAWKAAARHPDDPRAMKALDLAESRLRQISPDLMKRYDRNRLAGESRHDAMAHSIVETNQAHRAGRARPHGGRTTTTPPKANNLLTAHASSPGPPPRHATAAGVTTAGGPAAADGATGTATAPPPHSAAVSQWNGPVSANGKPIITGTITHTPATTGTATTPMARLRGMIRR